MAQGSSRVLQARSEDNEMVLPVPASRRHFAISADDKFAYIEDLGSANGVLLNNCRVGGRTTLKTGDIIRLGGDYHIEFQSLSPGGVPALMESRLS